MTASDEELPTQRNIGAVILAAGAGRRMGGVAKALLVRDGKTFLEHIVALTDLVGAGKRVVVIGPPFGDEVAEHARSLGLTTVLNHAPDRGMASSIALGFAAIADSDVDGAWLWPVDHPDVSASTLAALVAAWPGHDVARPRHAGRGGHPPLVGSAVFGPLAACGEVDGGARTVIAASDVIDVEVDDPGVVLDHDHPGDGARS